MDETWECIVVGGGAAGLSAALVLGRARRRTLVVDAGRQSNRPAEGMGGVLGHDGRPPADLYRMGHDELARYGVEVRAGSVAGAHATEAGFAVDLGGGAVEHARRVVLATGMDYRLPDLPGVAERFGRSVFHCPFCHGWEVREGRLAVLGHDDKALHRASLLRLWSDDVVLLTDGHDVDDVPAGVVVDDRPVDSLHGPGTDLEAVVFADGSERPLDGLLVPVRLEQRSPIAAQLGLRMAEPGPMPTEAVAVDTLGRTSVAGVYAAGDVATQSPSVATAVAAGAEVAKAIVFDVLAERR